MKAIAPTILFVLLAAGCSGTRNDSAFDVLSFSGEVFRYDVDVTITFHNDGVHEGACSSRRMSFRRTAGLVIMARPGTTYGSFSVLDQGCDDHFDHINFRDERDRRRGVSEPFLQLVQFAFSVVTPPEYQGSFLPGDP